MKGQLRPGALPNTWYLRAELPRGADGKRRSGGKR